MTVPPAANATDEANTVDESAFVKASALASRD
jgi:hypothetical protein